LIKFFQKKPPLNSEEYEKLHRELMDRERALSSLSVRLDALELQIKQLRGKFYREKQLEENEEITEQKEGKSFIPLNPFRAK